MNTCLKYLLIMVPFLSLVSAHYGFASGKEQSIDQHQCPASTEVTLYDASASDQELICDASTKAIQFLAIFGIEPHHPIRIYLTDTTIVSEGYLAYGSYDRIKDRIDLMTYPAILKGGENALMYNEPFDTIHYQGAVAHEIARAVEQQNMTEVPISQASQEYLAHSIQLAVLPDQRRENIIKKAAVEPWLPGDTISDVYMGINPTGFAVKSYLHLTGLKFSESFIKILLGSKWFYISVPDDKS